ncbi:S-adenosylmethionine:tRNA ribosyltransferase-isomerase [Pseudonocardiaceae bacterium YIM PH 21723]|nr:S-adenosylmethionine:tRNA ribosyltransferase-isomerase [Pseudonocardiaceae bacterium YIM PH 21723]
MTVHFELPTELNASEPPEARGLTRDGVRLLVADGAGVVHARFHQLDEFLRPGDLLVVNTSGTLAAAVPVRRASEEIVLHFSTELDDGDWVVELRTGPDGAAPLLDGVRGERLALPGGGVATLVAPHGDQERLWRTRIDRDVFDLLAGHGRPIRYRYVPESWPIENYQTVFALEPGSAEMPSAARPFTTELVTRLVAKGVLIAPILLHTGVSSQETGEPPQAERYRVPAHTARLVGYVRRGGGRVIAVGTTAARALESAVDTDGTVHAGAGWTDLVLGPDRPARVVSGLITGLHAPEASHLLLLEAAAGPRVVQEAYRAAVTKRYLWHEFGDVSLLFQA